MILIPSFNLSAEAETVTARNDLKLALKRVEDLQQAINGELDSELDSLARYESNLNISLYSCKYLLINNLVLKKMKLLDIVVNIKKVN